MGENLTRKILKAHLADGRLAAGEEIGIKIDEILIQDITGTAAVLHFEAMQLGRVRCKVACSYGDHNVLQVSEENTEDHQYLATAARKYGMWWAKPGSGIGHQIHQEHFACPGDTALGADSHTPHIGGMGVYAMGAGGLDVAVAMGGGPYYFDMPAVVRVNLTGALRPWSTAKDVILEMLRRKTAKGGFGKVFEYVGPGVVVSDDGLVMMTLAVVSPTIPDAQLKDFKIIVPRADKDDEELDAVRSGQLLQDGIQALERKSGSGRHTDSREGEHAFRILPREEVRELIRAE